MAFKTTPLYAEMLRFYAKARYTVDDVSGNKILPKIYNNGSSRSSKTYTAIQVILTFCDHNRAKPLYIAVLRETLVDCRKYTFKDFTEAIKLFGLSGECEITEFPNPKIKIWGSTIEFMGLPDDMKQPPRTDIVFFNEATEIMERRRVDGFLMRCERLAIFDWNPSYSSHWVFDGEKERNSLFTRTTYLDNPFLTSMVIDNIESKCPWDFSCSHIEQRNGFKVRVWDLPEDERPINQRNADANTIDRWYWLVYGEGIPAAREGAVFPDVMWINEFPATGFDEVTLGVDFGYTGDNTTLVRTGRSGMDATVECMMAQPTKNPEICFFSMKPHLEKEMERRKAEGIDNWDELWIVCESQDKYQNDVFVDSLNELAAFHGFNWNFFKISKKSIAAGVSIMKKFRLFLVMHPRFQIEQQNYCYKMGTNEPDPQSKFCDIWDATRYQFQHFFYWVNGNN